MEEEIPEHLIVDLDVREQLRAGEEPFSRIMAAVAKVGEGGALRLRTTFEPVPLFHVLGKRGFAHRARQEAHDDWTVLFLHSVGPAPDPELSTAPAGPVPVEEEAPHPRSAGRPASEPHTGGTAPGTVVELDVRGMEPPEPLLRTLAALDALPPGSTLVQLNHRTPRHLLPRLEELGFGYTVEHVGPDLVRTTIRHVPMPRSTGTSSTDIDPR
jgi:uncharacterized protein (DUF2249 family)